jgi:hypothetical protein
MMMMTEAVGLGFGLTVGVGTGVGTGVPTGTDVGIAPTAVLEDELHAANVLPSAPSATSTKRP